MRIIGTIFMIIGLIFTTYETSYFGHNLLPATFMEGFCDFMGLCLVICGSLLTNKK
jgi:hypothetical protein